MSKKIFNYAFILIIVGILAVANNYVFASWTTQTATPPANNALAPLNVGSEFQNKTGVLGVKGLVVGTTVPLAPSIKLNVVGGAIKATGGLIIETRTSPPRSPITGQIWLRTNI